MLYIAIPEGDVNTEQREREICGMEISSGILNSVDVKKHCNFW